MHRKTIQAVMGHSADIKPWRREGREESQHSSSLMAAELADRSTRNALVCFEIRKILINY